MAVTIGRSGKAQAPKRSKDTFGSRQPEVRAVRDAPRPQGTRDYSEVEGDGWITVHPKPSVVHGVSGTVGR